MQQITYHDDAELMAEKLKETRTALAGEFFVKQERTTILPHPSSVDKDSDDAKVRYDIYLTNAEYDNYPLQTLDSLVGRMKFDDAVITLPERISYLIESADGDGMSLTGMMSQSAYEVLPVKWECLVVDYQGLSNANIDDLSAADVIELNPRATIKSYTRENVANWHFERINGALQLTFILLREIGSTFDKASAKRKSVESFLILALDENSNYYQQKVVKSSDGLVIGEQDFVIVSGSPLKWLPVLFASDKELPAGCLPKELGYLSSICDLALARYRMSAEYKESLRNLPPTTYVFGANNQYHEQFPQANGGRTFIMTGSGAVNVMPEGCTVQIVGGNMTTADYLKDFEKNKNSAMALGAVIHQVDGTQKTAEEVATVASEQNARLVTLASALESVYRRLCLYCGMFEGLFAPDDIENHLGDIELRLTRDFASSKITPQERDAVRNDYLAGLITRAEALAQLEDGGVLTDTAENMLMLEDSGQEFDAVTDTV